MSFEILTNFGTWGANQVEIRGTRQNWPQIIASQTDSLTVLNDPTSTLAQKVLRMRVRPGDTAGQPTVNSRVQLATNGLWYDGNPTLYVCRSFMVTTAFPSTAGDNTFDPWISTGSFFASPFANASPNQHFRFNHATGTSDSTKLGLKYSDGGGVDHWRDPQTVDQWRGKWRFFILEFKLSSSASTGFVIHHEYNQTNDTFDTKTYLDNTQKYFYASIDSSMADAIGSTAATATTNKVDCRINFYINKQLQDWYATHGGPGYMDFYHGDFAITTTLAEAQTHIRSLVAGSTTAPSPVTPTNVVANRLADQTASLKWDATTDPSFQYFAVRRNTSNLATTDPSWTRLNTGGPTNNGNWTTPAATDTPGAGTFYYFVTEINTSGVVSSPSNVAQLSSVAGPSVSFTVTPSSPKANIDTATLDASLTTPVSGHTISAYSWSITGPATGTLTGVKPTYKFTKHGTYTVTLTVTQDDAVSATLSQQVVVVGTLIEINEQFTSGAGAFTNVQGLTSVSGGAARVDLSSV